MYTVVIVSLQTYIVSSTCSKELFTGAWSIALSFATIITFLLQVSIELKKMVGELAILIYYRLRERNDMGSW